MDLKNELDIFFEEIFKPFGINFREFKQSLAAHGDFSNYRSLIGLKRLKTISKIPFGQKVLLLHLHLVMTEQKERWQELRIKNNKKF